MMCTLGVGNSLEMGLEVAYAIWKIEGTNGEIVVGTQWNWRLFASNIGKWTRSRGLDSIHVDTCIMDHHGPRESLRAIPALR